MCNQRREISELNAAEVASASERSFELLIESALLLDGFTPDAAQNLRNLFSKNQGIGRGEILNAILPDKEETEEPDASNQAD